MTIKRYISKNSQILVGYKTHDGKYRRNLNHLVKFLNNCTSYLNITSHTLLLSKICILVTFDLITGFYFINSKCLLEVVAYINYNKISYPRNQFLSSRTISSPVQSISHQRQCNADPKSEISTHSLCY